MARQTCGTVMTKNPVCCAPGDTVQRAAQIMKQQDVGSIPVCESRRSKRLVGMITDRDLAIKVLAAGSDSNTRVGDVMTERVFVCRMDDELEQALSLMESEQLRRVPVVDREGNIVGIIAQADIATRVRDLKKTGEVVSEISKPHAKAA